MGTHSTAADPLCVDDGKAPQIDIISSGHHHHHHRRSSSLSCGCMWVINICYWPGIQSQSRKRADKLFMRTISGQACLQWVATEQGLLNNSHRNLTAAGINNSAMSWTVIGLVMRRGRRRRIWGRRTRGIFCVSCGCCVRGGDISFQELSPKTD